MSSSDRAQWRTCVDRIHPRDMDRLRAAADRPPEDRDRVRMALDARKKWDNGRTLKVRFIDGLQEVQGRVIPFARLWEPHANITFDFGDHDDPDIRVSFVHQGSWSYLGSDALGIRADLPTMNYGWLTPEVSDEEYERVVVHEFGHALGAIHEHQNPSGGIPWDEEKVYAYYGGPPNNWSREQVDINVLGRYSRDFTQFTEFDAESIMLYPVPNELTLGDFEVGFNSTMSKTDKGFMAEIYPDRAVTGVPITIDGGAVSASIGHSGEQDEFVFDVDRPGVHVIETAGPTDVVMSLFGPDSRETLAAFDDDTGVGLNARIEVPLEAGRYHLVVGHFQPLGTGAYQVHVATR
jgi:hypothetical protein